MSKNSDPTTDAVHLSAEPFVQQHLDQIFQVSPKHPDRLISRENSWLEFKQSFSWAAREEYARTVAAYANCRGGYLVFGVKDKPRTVVGVDIGKFEAIDPTKISEFFNSALSVEIDWETRVTSFAGKDLVLLYVHAAKRKPVIVAHGGGKHLVEGEIYYRYRGRTQRIRYTELQEILNEQLRRDQAAWFKLLTKIARVGVDNVALVDLNTGKGMSPGSNFLIDEALLPQLRFIQQGHFVEKEGTPAIRLVGDAIALPSATIQPAKRIEVAKPIHAPDIVKAFLTQATVASPLEYIRQICFEASGFLPVHYFGRLAKRDRVQLCTFVNDVSSTHQSRKKLISRLSGDEDLYLSPPKDLASAGSKLRAGFIEQHRKKGAKKAIDVQKVKFAARAFRSLPKEEIDFGYAAMLLLDWFTQYYADEKAAAADDLRRAICYLDNIFFSDPS